MKPRGQGDGGQATVELALVLPLVMLLLLLVTQVGLLIRDQVLVVHAAREAARQAAVDPSSDGAKNAAVAGSGLDRRRLQVEMTGRGRAGTRVTVRLRYSAPAEVPIVGAALGDLELTAEATMRVEH